MTILVLAVFVAVFVIHRITPVPEIKTVVDIGGERNLPTAWNTLLLLGVASLAAAVPVRARRRGHDAGSRLAWAVVAAAATYLAVDEAFELHERLRSPVDSISDRVPTYAWVIPGALVAALGATALVLAGRRLPRTARPRLGAALGIYGASAVGIEALNGFLREHDLDLAYALGTLLEEAGEMGACVLAVTAIVDVLAASALGAGSDPAEASAATGARFDSEA